VQALRSLDLWLESVDTLEVLPNFPDEKPEYSLPTVADIDWKQHSDLLSRIVRERELHRVIGASTVQIVDLLDFCWKYNLTEIISEVYGHLLKPTGKPPLPQCTAETADDLINFLHYRPTLVIHFTGLCPWSQLPDDIAQKLQSRALDLLRAVILSSNKMGVLVLHHLQALLQEKVLLYPMAVKDFLEIAAIVVKNPELLFTILMECQDALSKIIKDLDDASIVYLLRNMYGIALDHNEEADDTQDVAPGLWTFKLQEGVSGKTLSLTSRRRVDAPKVSRLAVGDHVQFVASKEPVNSTSFETTTFDALVEASSDNEIRFRCFCQPPSFVHGISWALKHCGSFVTSQATAEALVQLLVERDQCCGVYQSLGFSKTTASVPSNPPTQSSCEEIIDGLNSSQSLAVTVSLSKQMTCLWGPPGTGKTTTIVALLRSALKRDTEERILVTAPTHNAVDNVLRQYIRKALDKGSSLPQPVRISTEVSSSRTIMILC
jgi:AAA domain